MTPEIAQRERTVAVETSAHAIPPEPWEIALAEEAGFRLAESIPHLSTESLAAELRRRLLQERRSRERQNLNHWPRHAPRYLNALVRSLANREAWRRRRIDAFYRSDYAKACTIAGARVPSPEEAEDAAAEAFARLVANRTSIRYFYRTLNQVIVDRQRQLEVERAMFAGLDDPSAPVGGRGGAVLERAASCRGDSRDPINVLMDRRNRVARPLMVAQAKRNPKWRGARRWQWTKELETSRAETAPQTHM